jgi:hypothetical protein
MRYCDNKHSGEKENLELTGAIFKEKKPLYDVPRGNSGGLIAVLFLGGGDHFVVVGFF